MKRIIFLFPLLLLSACGLMKPEVKYIEKPVYIKCKIPEVPKADLEPIPDNATYPEKLQVILNNYFKLEKEVELLREAIKACE